MGRDRLVPEFNFMDPRAIGSYDMSLFDTSFEAVWAMDVDEAGSDGIGGRPPSNEDGTPNETLADQVVRLRQLLSVLETQYSGDTILLVFVSEFLIQHSLRDALTCTSHMILYTVNCAH